jgi:hypothetical protein
MAQMLVKSAPLQNMSRSLVPTATRSSLDVQHSQQIMTNLLQRQDMLEHAQSRFMRFQMAINAFNLSKTHRLVQTQRKLEGQIVAGKAALLALENSLEKEGQRVSELQTVVSAAEVELQQVKQDLNALEKTLQDQSEQLSRQGSEIQRLSVSKQQREALVEAFVLLASITAIRSSFVNFPLSTMLMVLPKRSRFTLATKSIIRLTLFVVLMRKIRSYAILTGWTSDNASLIDYIVAVAFNGNSKSAV